MEQITVTLPDGSTKQAPKGMRVGDFIREHIGQGLAKAAVVARLDGKDVDLSRPLECDVKLQVLTTKSPEALEVARHDAAHIVASAVQKLFPGTQVTLGPAIEDGFYYDFYREQPFTPEDLERIEKEANEEIARNLPFVREEVTADEAIKLFESKGEHFKVEVIRGIVDRGAKTLSLYRHGDWVDFCEGPHGPSTGKVGAIKLLNVAGAYWRGDPNRPMLQRIYGTAFFSKAELDAHLKRLEEAKKRDHRKLGKELELFTLHPFAPGAPFWLPKGVAIYNALAGAMRRMLVDNGYLEVKTPLIYNKNLWETSGHWGKYRENMFLILNSETEEHDISLKPMNCPSHHLLYGMTRRSYRELPLRFMTQDVLHRNEPTGSLGGLTRVRQFQQDDAHIYLAEDQIADEVKRLVTLIDTVYKPLNLAYTAKFATRPPQRLGEDALWDRAEAALKSALESTGVPYELKPGDGAFYGPKIDFDVSDSIGRKWQLGTIQLDYLAPERFDLNYVGSDNREHRPVVIHRAIYGSFERFIAILIEHFAGAFPAWLSPVQVKLVTVADRHDAWANEVARKLRALHYRVEVDDRVEKLGAKIREAQIQKIPYTLVIGDNEVEQGGVSPRRYGGEDLKLMKLEAFLELLGREASVP
ncbi:MAG: threonine--tRNA ligase, partial [Myxococcales bacterium]